MERIPRGRKIHDLEYDTIKRNFFERLFGIRPICPRCEIKMRMSKIEWPYAPGWRCEKCKWISWELWWNEES